MLTMMKLINLRIILRCPVNYTEIQELIKTIDESITSVNEWAVANKMTLNEKNTKGYVNYR